MVPKIALLSGKVFGRFSHVLLDFCNALVACLPGQKGRRKRRQGTPRLIENG